MKRIILCALLAALIRNQEAISATYYVRTDGGTGTQCNGRADAAYSGSGTNQNAAFNHPFWVLAPTGTALMQGGDTLIIAAGSYKMGYGAPGAAGCNSAWTWDCVAAAIPAGPSASKPTVICGKGWDTRTGAKPELWASERPWQVFTLGGSNIELRWLDITDHSSCIYNSPSHGCNRSTYPHGDFGDIGIVATSGNNVFIKDVDVHGFSNAGFHVGGVSNWTLEDVTIRGNGFVGWDGDVGAGVSSDSGNMIFRRVTIEFNGCGETYPEKGIGGCFSQDQGGYGDGIGTASTGGNWIFEDCNISHNTSDGLDLLYHSGNGTITIKRSRFEGNAGNQVKTAADAFIENCVIVGNCNYFNGKPITETAGGDFNNCRAMGNAVSLNYAAGRKVTIVNSTVYSSGDVIIMTGGGNSCNGTEQLVSRNNIFYADWDFTSGNTEKSAFYYAAGADGNGSGACGLVAIDNKNSIVYNAKTNEANASNNVINTNPNFTGPLSGDNYNVIPSPGSVALQPQLLPGAVVLASVVVPDHDYLSRGRPLSGANTWGAYELNPTGIGIQQEGPCVLCGALMLKYMPNFLSPQSEVVLTLPRQTSLQLSVYDLTGKKVRTLLPFRQLMAGFHRFIFDPRVDDKGQKLSHSIYILRMEKTPTEQKAIRMMIMK